MSGAADEVLAAVWRRDWGRLLALLVAQYRRLDLAEDDLTVRVCAAAVTGAFRVIDEDVSRAVIVDGRTVTQSEVLSLIDCAIRDATNGRLGGPVTTH